MFADAITWVVAATIAIGAGSMNLASAGTPTPEERPQTDGGTQSERSRTSEDRQTGGASNEPSDD